MASNSRIEWTDATWNPMTGCSKVSQGCKHCYAEREWPRLSANPKTSYYGRKFTDVATHPDRLDDPLHWTKPRMIFVNSMSDIFHEDVPDEFIDAVFARMALAPQHVFQVLTKRPERMAAYLSTLTDNREEAVGEQVRQISKGKHSGMLDWPLPNVWLGVSVEDQKSADERIPFLFKSAAAVRWLSIEPLLGPVSLRWLAAFPENAPRVAEQPSGRTDHLDGLRRLDWVVVGGESGPKARPMHPDWVRTLRDQCEAADVPFLFKQWGEYLPITVHGDDNDPIFYPADGGDPGRLEGLEATSIEVDGQAFARVGKKKSGRMIDGHTHDAYPKEPA